MVNVEFQRAAKNRAYAMMRLTWADLQLQFRARCAARQTMAWLLRPGARSSLPKKNPRLRGDF
jgi:hypothetical protein